jgi:hypothetical protein
MLHAAKVQQMHPGAVVAIYPCRFCGGIHVGRCRINSKLVRAAKKLQKIISHPNFWLHAPIHVQEHMTKAKEEIDALMEQSPEFRMRCQSE